MAQVKEDQATLGQTTETSDFSALLQKEFKPKSDRAREEVETAVRTLAAQVLEDKDLIADDAVNSINAIVAEIDRKLAEQINLIMHNPQFQALESSWRGLHYLINNTETDEMLKIKVFNISKKDLAKTLKKYKGTAWDQSPIFKKVYEVEYGQLGGEPYGCLVGDYYFDHSAPDVELLSGMAQIAAASHAPFIAAASPTTMQMDSWGELANPRDLTKIAISDRREAELAKNGFMPLIHRKNSDIAAFIGAQSLNKPAEYDDPDATANANLAARLPYMFACCRFAHYLKCIVRDKIGSFKERADMERWLSDWILNYVDGDPAKSSEETKARKPLAAAEVVVEEVEGNPGYYTSKFFLRPHYQLEGLTVSLRLVSKLPSAKAA